MADADERHSAACNDHALTFHAATGGDAGCICGVTTCAACDGEGQVAVGFGIYSNMRPAIARCPDCGGE